MHADCAKALDHLPDPKSVWQHEWLKEGNLQITVRLIEWEQKDYLFRIPVADKLERVIFTKMIATRFFQAEKFDKACKTYTKIKTFLGSKDVKNNFCEEDVNETGYRDAIDQLEKFAVKNITNLAVVSLK